MSKEAEKKETKALWGFYQVIQAVTVWSPNVVGHLTFSKGHLINHPIKVTKNCQVQFPDTFVFGALPKPWFTVDRNTYVTYIQLI